MELDVGVSESSAVQQLNDQLATVATRQKELLESGTYKLNEFGAMKVKDSEAIDGEYTVE